LYTTRIHGWPPLSGLGIKDQLNEIASTGT
jgi:hypothetical protein